MKITILDAETLGQDIELSVFEQFGEVMVYQRTQATETIERIGNSQIAITNKVVIDQEVMDACNALKLICISATGMNNVDLEYARLKGIKVMNVAGYSTNSVAQFTFATLFAFVHQLHTYDKYVKSGDYSNSGLFTHIANNFHEISGKTYGIIGLGTIGQKVASIAEAFGATVVYYSTSGKNNTTGFQRVSLDELFETADIISIHCPLNENTKNLVTSHLFQKSKSNLVILNMGRGGIINEQDLANAIDNNQIAGAIVDVFTNEPIDKENPLMKLKNTDRVLLTPHIAWASVEARQSLIQKLVNNIEAFLSSEK